MRRLLGCTRTMARAEIMNGIGGSCPAAGHPSRWIATSSENVSAIAKAKLFVRHSMILKSRSLSRAHMMLLRYHLGLGWRTAIVPSTIFDTFSACSTVLPKSDLPQRPSPFQRHSRMCQAQDQNTDDHHSAVEHHEQSFIIGQLPFESLAQLCNTERTTDQDGGDCDGDGQQETAEALRPSED